jgi:hypothetical protein
MRVVTRARSRFEIRVSVAKQGGFVILQTVVFEFPEVTVMIVVRKQRMLHDEILHFNAHLTILPSSFRTARLSCGASRRLYVFDVH